MSAIEPLAVTVTGYGLVGSCASLLQARRIVKDRAAGHVSLGFLAIVAGGYLLWLMYGLTSDNTPLIVVDGAGLLCGVKTALVALRFRSASGTSHRSSVGASGRGTFVDQS